MLPLSIAAAVLLVTVALMVVRPLLAPREASGTRTTEPAAAPAGDAAVSGPPAVDATDRAALEALIAECRLRMERDATGAGR
jgi:hypothetical protein